MQTMNKPKHSSHQEVKAFEITPKQLIEVIDFKLKMNPSPTIFIWGGPGIGKTWIVNDACKRAKINMIPFRAAYRDPTDIKGFPCVEVDATSGQKVTAWARPKWFPLKGVTTERQCIFADEVNRSAPMTMNALMELFEERRIEEFELPTDTCIIAACNREQDGGGVNRMPQALANRGLHYYLTVSAEDWYDWAADNGVHPYVFAYLRTQSDALYQFSPDQKAFPTPRSWVKVSDCLKMDPPKSVLRADAIAAVGYETANGFLSFIEQVKLLPTIDAIWMNPDTAIVPENASALYAICRTLARAMTQQNFEQALVYLKRCPREYQVIAIKDALDKDNTLSFAKGFSQFVTENKAILA